MSQQLHVRTPSIRRTPSDLSKSLAKADLPPPEAITLAGKKDETDQITQGLNAKIGEMELDQPEGELYMLSFFDGLSNGEGQSSNG